MAAEIELKLTLDPAALKAFRASPVLAGLRPSRQRVLNTYFDTPDCLLARERMALRLRRIGRRWLQTLKTAGTAAGGLSRRGEWEFAVPEGVLDLAFFQDTPLAELKVAPRLHEFLQPAFTTDFQRTRWLIEPAPGQRVEVALDVGEVRCADQVMPLCEVELELLEGEPETLLTLARALVASLPLMPARASKAERGYRLFRGEPLAVVKARAVKLDPDDTPAHALRVCVAAGVDHFLANVEGALASDDPEFIHQLRVALRRLRSLLRLFKVEAPQADLKWLAAMLGAARDWDVFVTEVWPPLSTALTNLNAAEGAGADELGAVMERAASARRAARYEARAALRAPRTALLILALADLALSGEPTAVKPTGQVTPLPAPDGLPPLSPPPESLLAFATRHIRRRHKRLLRDADGLAGMNAAARHQVRIDAKKLRYAVDGFAGLYRRERLDRWLTTLAAIQAALGEANDAATALGLLDRLAPSPGLQRFAQGWFAAKAEAHAGDVVHLFAEFAAVRRFWTRVR
ncbi:MAG: CYTH and CHAD domain-containing protein [Burkholderiales bacterium]|nr:CYTH and CHAD domain-containing protein [Burkholderiales bacterium]